MTQQETQMEVKENKARIEMLEKRMSALLEILKKEGVTTYEEVNSIVNGMIKGDQNE